METPAERHERLVERGVRHYRETFIRIFVRECQGNRIPGTSEISEEEVRALFRARPPEEWQALAQTDPEKALAELRHFARLEGQTVPEMNDDLPQPAAPTAVY